MVPIFKNQSQCWCAPGSIPTLINPAALYWLFFHKQVEALLDENVRIHRFAKAYTIKPIWSLVVGKVVNERECMRLNVLWSCYVCPFQQRHINPSVYMLARWRPETLRKPWVLMMNDRRVQCWDQSVIIDDDNDVYYPLELSGFSNFQKCCIHRSFRVLCCHRKLQHSLFLISTHHPPFKAQSHVFDSSAESNAHSPYLVARTQKLICHRIDQCYFWMIGEYDDDPKEHWEHHGMKKEAVFVARGMFFRLDSLKNYFLFLFWRRSSHSANWVDWRKCCFEWISVYFADTFNHVTVCMDFIKKRPCASGKQCFDSWCLIMMLIVVKTVIFHNDNDL